MTIDDQVRRLEIAKRTALWALADLQPGDPRADQVLDELDEVDQAARILVAGNECSSHELTNAVRSRSRSRSRSHNGVLLVVEDSIPEPWRQRFSAASVGSTRLAAGPYFHDFEKFVLTWNAEMAHLEAHRARRQDRCSE